MNQPYLFDQDSSLLGEALESLSGGGIFLEIGAGRGSNLARASRKFDLAVGTDILRLPEKFLDENLKQHLIVADRATCFRNNTFDVVAFNPPYLPSASLEDKAVDGGPTGIEVSLSFLSSALKVIKDDGVILMLTSSESSLEAFETYCVKRDLRHKVVAKRSLFFEELSVYKISKGDGQQ